MTLTREDWFVAAIGSLRRGGIDGVRVDVLARELGVSRGSFYWHFGNRQELLEMILARWEEETAWLVAGASGGATPRERALRYFEMANASPYPPDREIFAWARRDGKVARRVEAIEAKRTEFFEGVLRDAGATGERSRELAEVLYLATLGWLERRWRSAAGGYAFESFSRDVIDLVLREATGPAATPLGIPAREDADRGA
ncbi:MAG: TetR/AcrR family transcriptional regulator [Gemmatimonadota bacterium]